MIKVDRMVGVALAAVVLAVTGSGAPAHAATITNYIGNTGGIGLGVIHARDGSYVHGQYDAILPVDRSTWAALGWNTTAGWYTGPGYCTRQWRSDHPGEAFRRQLPDLGAGQHFIGSQTAYEVEAYRC